jgi:hypothetical protein
MMQTASSASFRASCGQCRVITLDHLESRVASLSSSAPIPRSRILVFLSAGSSRHIVPVC